MLDELLKYWTFQETRFEWSSWAGCCMTFDLVSSLRDWFVDDTTPALHISHVYILELLIPLNMLLLSFY
jgi:hypothetical protein